MISAGVAFENWLESESIKAYDNHKILGYEREELKSSLRKSRRAQGKHDFKYKLNDGRYLVLECKSVDCPSRMTLFGSAPMIKPHQLSALRENTRQGGVSAFLLQYRRTESVYMLTIDDLDSLIIKYGLFKSLDEKWLTRRVASFDDELAEV